MQQQGAGQSLGVVQPVLSTIRHTHPAAQMQCPCRGTAKILCSSGFHDGEGVTFRGKFWREGTAGARLYRERTINCDLPFDCTNTLAGVQTALCISILDYLLDTLHFCLGSLSSIFKCK